MKLRIIGYLEVNTNSTDVWIELQKMYNDLTPENDNDFESDVVELINEDRIRFCEKDGLIKLSLCSSIENILSERKESALIEMREELQKCIDSEEYEKATEWKSMIDEYENKEL